MTTFNDKAVLITGASRGIGAAAALQFAGQGARVLLMARTKNQIEAIAKQITDNGGQAACATGDVSRYADMQAAVKQCCDQFGGLDILVNNAGVIDPIARLADSDPEGWAQAFDINAKGVYFGIRAATDQMIPNGGGTILNVSSGAATSALEGWSHYCSAKAAALMLTKCMHLEYADQGIRVLGLSPGTVRTEMQILVKASGLNPVSELDPSVHIPPEWAAKAILWLCTDAGRQFDGDDFALRPDENKRMVGLID